VGTLGGRSFGRSGCACSSWSPGHHDAHRPRSSRIRPANDRETSRNDRNGWSIESAGQEPDSSIAAGSEIGSENTLKVETRVRTPLGIPGRTRSLTFVPFRGLPEGPVEKSERYHGALDASLDPSTDTCPHHSPGSRATRTGRTLHSVIELEQLADLNLGALVLQGRFRAAHRPIHRLLSRVDSEDRVPRDLFPWSCASSSATVLASPSCLTLQPSDVVAVTSRRREHRLPGRPASCSPSWHAPTE
jgi:hypothetical protein